MPIFCHLWIDGKVTISPVPPGRWVKAGETDGPNTELDVEGLTPGKHYKFRVKAVNKEGASEPLTTTQSIHAKNPYGEYG